MMWPGAQRQEDLLDLAQALSTVLRGVTVPRLAGPSAEATGVPASVVAHATSFLARVRELPRFRQFIARFDDLDRMTAPNPDNAKADHRVVREELERFLADHPDLSAGELLYVLSWARRLLPKPIDAAAPARGKGPAKGRGPAGSGPEKAAAIGLKGSQMAAALRRALGGGQGTERDETARDRKGRR